MSSTNEFRKKLRNGKDGYYFEQEDIDPKTLLPYQPLYDVAVSFERQRMFGISTLSPETQLEILLKEIKIRVKITKSEIFKIGELLIHAKKICQQEGKGFQDWITNNLDFSYETANNFMNVYKHCLGVREIAMNVKPSILYQISAPSFPDELREYLFDAEQLNEMTNGKLTEITRKYKEGGFEAIEDDIEALNSGRLAIKQSTYTLDMVENALRTLEALKDKIEGHSTGRDIVPFEKQIKSHEPEAFDVNSKLFTALQSAIDVLDAAQKESQQILSDVHTRLLKKCGVVESDGRIQKRKQAEFNAELEKKKKKKCKISRSVKFTGVIHPPESRD